MAGCKNAAGYVVFSVDNRIRYAHRLAWLYMTDEYPSPEIDHVNGRHDDNRFCNLRLASRVENSRNTPLHQKNTSGQRGVHWHGGSGKWRAVIVVNGRNIHLGMFTDLEPCRCCLCGYNLPPPAIILANLLVRTASRPFHHLSHTRSILPTLPIRHRTRRRLPNLRPTLQRRRFVVFRSNLPGDSTNNVLRRRREFFAVSSFTFEYRDIVPAKGHAELLVRGKW